MKSGEQQAALALHRTRDLLVKQRTQLVNMVRGLLAEFGIEMARGLHHALELARRLSAGETQEVPALAQRVVTGLADQIGALQVQLAKLEKELLAWHRASDLSQRLATIPGVGVISATALAASVIAPERFRSGRQFAASLGLTPLQNCSGGRERLGRIPVISMLIAGLAFNATTAASTSRVLYIAGVGYLATGLATVAFRWGGADTQLAVAAGGLLFLVLPGLYLVLHARSRT